MRNLLVMVLGFLVLPLVSLANPVVVSATGWGPTEFAAISSAKRQAIIDAEAAGFSIRDGYRSNTAKVVDLTRSNDAYIARVDVEVKKDISSKRFLILLDGDDEQLPRLNAVIERARLALAGKPIYKEKNIELVYIKAPISLKDLDLKNPQATNLEFSLNELTRNHQANAIYLLRKIEAYSPYLFIKLRKDNSSEKTIHIIRADIANGSPSLADQIVSALHNDMKGKTDISEMQSAITIHSNGVTVRKGQRVFIYTTTLKEEGIEETTILTNGVISEIYGAKVRVLTEIPLNSVPINKIRLGIIPNRSIIKESDW